MSRPIAANNLAEINSPHAHEVLMLKMDFDEPAFVHSGVGDITFDGNTYVGVGAVGSVDSVRESAQTNPLQLRFTMSGIDAAQLDQAMNSGTFGDALDLMIGFRQDDGDLVADPETLWGGTYEYANDSAGDDHVISITATSDIAVLEQKNGARFSDEYHRVKYPSDTGFEFIAAAGKRDLIWGGRPVHTGGRTGPGHDRPPRRQR